MTDWRLSGRRFFLAVSLSLGAMAMAAPWSRGALTYYTSQASFTAAAPGLPVDMFSGTGVRTGPFSDMAGLAVNTVSQGSNNLIFNGSSLAPNYFGDTLTLTFSPNVTAVGAVVDGAPASGGNGPAASLIMDVYLQGSTTTAHETDYSLATNAPSYFGVVSTTPINSVTFLYDYSSDAYTNVSSVSYGNVPEPAAPGMLSIGALLLLRRRRPEIAR